MKLTHDLNNDKSLKIAIQIIKNIIYANKFGWKPSLSLVVLALKLGIEPKSVNYVCKNMKQYELSGIIVDAENFISIAYDYSDGADFVEIERLKKKNYEKKNNNKWLMKKEN
jgi:hypothetical protein